MAAVASIKFTQGATTDLAGRALVGSVGSPVVVTNGNNTDVTHYKIELIDVPLGSAVPETTLADADGAVPSAPFTPDVSGTYQVKLTLNNNPLLVDVRDFIVENAYGWKVPAAGSNRYSFNYAGQLKGWKTGLSYILGDIAARLGAMNFSSPPPIGDGAPNTGAFVTVQLGVDDVLYAPILAGGLLGDTDNMPATDGSFFLDEDGAQFVLRNGVIELATGGCADIDLNTYGGAVLPKSKYSNRYLRVTDSVSGGDSLVLPTFLGGWWYVENASGFSFPIVVGATNLVLAKGAKRIVLGDGSGATFFGGEIVVGTGVPSDSGGTYSAVGSLFFDRTARLMYSADGAGGWALVGASSYVEAHAQLSGGGTFSAPTTPTRNTILTANITTTNGTKLAIDMSGSGTKVAATGTLYVFLKVDGTYVSGCGVSAPSGYAVAFNCKHVLSGVAPGAHVVTVEWESTVGSVDIVPSAFDGHLALGVREIA